GCRCGRGSPRTILGGRRGARGLPEKREPLIMAVAASAAQGILVSGGGPGLGWAALRVGFGMRHAPASEGTRGSSPNATPRTTRPQDGSGGGWLGGGGRGVGQGWPTPRPSDRDV